MKTLSDVSECVKEGERERGMERIDKQVTMSECAVSLFKESR